MSKLSVFPKCFLDQLSIEKSMSIDQWIDLASTLPVQGLEFYSLFLPDSILELNRIRDVLNKKNLEMPMLCCSPDFTSPNKAERNHWVEMEKKWIELTSFFGGKTCRVLSGQNRPDISRKQGIDWVVECIDNCLEFAEEKRVILAMENHYKDPYWKYPEFAQKMNVFLQIVEQIDSPWFGVQYDPSNTIVAEEDPLEFLEAVKCRVVSMHASDRYLKDKRLVHGVVGKGLNDYDSIFRTLRSIGFDGWISIEDGLNGMEELKESANFLVEKFKQYFPKTGLQKTND